jgi:hypothetical protein
MFPQRPRWLLPPRCRLKIKLISCNSDKSEYKEANSIANLVMLAFRKSEASYFFLGVMLSVGPSLCSLFIFIPSVLLRAHSWPSRSGRLGIPQICVLPGRLGNLFGLISRLVYVSWYREVCSLSPDLLSARALPC